MIIDRTYFTGPLVIPGLGAVPIQNTVDEYIALYEPELLSKALGESLATALTDAIDALGSDEEMDQKWLDILNGVTFTKNSRQYKYPGIKPAITAYVWFHYINSISTQVTAVGVVKSQAENAAVISPSFTMAPKWNGMSKNIWMLWDFLSINTDTYTEYNQNEVSRCSFGTINGFGI